MQNHQKHQKIQSYSKYLFDYLIEIYLYKNLLI